jgi:hypothetical protein
MLEITTLSTQEAIGIWVAKLADASIYRDGESAVRADIMPLSLFVTSPRGANVSPANCGAMRGTARCIFRSMSIAGMASRPSPKHRKVEAHLTCACKVLSQSNAERCLDRLATAFRMMAITWISSALIVAIIRTY